MDSFAQELIDEIIDHIPRWDMAASSLVARRWRRRSQQRYFEFVEFSYSEELALWETNIPQDPDGIPSYVHHVRFRNTPLLVSMVLGRLLGTFRSIVSLAVVATSLLRPGSSTSLVSFGEFLKGTTRLTLIRLSAPLAAVATLIVSFPNLEELVLSAITTPISYEQHPVLPVASRMGPLKSLVIRETQKEVRTKLAQCRFKFRVLYLNPSDEGVEQFIADSSETMIALTLVGMQLLRTFLGLASILTRPPDLDSVSTRLVDLPLPVIHLPPFPSLTRVRVNLGTEDITARLAGLLSSIRSAPELSSVTFSLSDTWSLPRDFPSSGNWTLVDKWLAWVFTTRTMAKGGLRVVLAGWLGGDQNWKGYFPEFRRAGGKLRKTIHDPDYWNPEKAMRSWEGYPVPRLETE